MGIFRQFPYTNFHDMNLDWILGEIKKLIDEWAAFNTEWCSWKDEVDNFMKWALDQGIPEAVAEKIEEMYNNGELAAIFAEVLNKQKGNNIALHQKFLLTHFGCRYKTDAYTDDDYAMIQSFTTDGTYFYTCGYRAGNAASSDTNDHPDEDYIVIRKYDSDFTEIAHNKIAAHHGNASAIFNGKWYISNSNTVLTVVDPTDLTIIETIDVAAVNGYAITKISELAVVDDVLYGGNDKIWYVLDENMMIVNVINVEYPDYFAKAWQDICYYNGYILRMTWPNTIIQYSLTGQIINIFNIGPITVDNFITECESICVYNNVLYIVASGWAGYPSGTMINQIFTTNLERGEYGFNKDHQNSYGRTDIYVQGSYTGKISDGTKDKPFKSLSWACVIAKALYNSIHPITIHVLSDVPEYACIAGARNVIISGEDDDGNAVIRNIFGLNIDHCGSVFVRNIHLTANVNDNCNVNYSKAPENSIFHCSNTANVTTYSLTEDGGAESNLKPFFFGSISLHNMDWRLTGFDTPGVIGRSSCIFGYIENTDLLNPFGIVNYGSLIFNKNANVHFKYNSQLAYKLFEQLYVGAVDFNNNDTIPLANTENNLTNTYEFYLIVVNIDAVGQVSHIVSRYETAPILSGVYYYNNTYYNYAIKLRLDADDITIVYQQNEGNQKIQIRRIYAYV